MGKQDKYTVSLSNKFDEQIMNLAVQFSDEFVVKLIEFIDFEFDKNMPNIQHDSEEMLGNDGSYYIRPITLSGEILRLRFSYHKYTIILEAIEIL